MTESAQTQTPEDAIRAAAAAAVVVDLSDFRGPDEAGNAPAGVDRCAVLPQNDVGNAARLLIHYGERLLFVRGLGWLTWAGTHWDVERGETTATLWAQKVAGRIRKEAEALQQWPLESEADFAKRCEARRKWSVASGMGNRITQMLAQAAPRKAVSAEVLDARPDLFCCESGTFEFWRAEDEAGDKVGGFRLREHRPGDMITRFSPVVYDPAAPCPRWEKFLCEVQPDHEKRLYLQRIAGYALTGWTAEEKVFLSYGTGSNGKSIFWEVMGRLMGGYSITLSIDTFLDQPNRTGGGPTPDLARLPGVRLVRAGEPGQGKALAEDMIKRVTGTDKLTARQLHQQQFEFSPCFKLALQTNHKPKIRGQDNGIWRRLDLLGWEQVFVDPWDAADNPGKPLKDKGLMAALLAEMPGILNWALAGYVEWAKSGIATPDGVRAETAEYRADSNPLGQFVADCTAPTGRTQAATLYKAYSAWCRREAIDPLSQSAFGKRLADMGIKREKISVMYWAIELKDYGLLGGDDADKGV